MDTNRRIKIATGKTSVLDWMKSRFVDTAIMVVGFAVITLGIAAMSDSAFAAEPEGRDVAVASQDTLPQQGNIQFLGLLTERQASEVARPKDSMLLKINRRLLSGPGRSPREFYMLSKRINPMEGEMLADSQDGQWNTFNLFQAALAAEGNRTPVQVKQLESRMEQIVRDMQQKLESSDAADEGADARKLTEKLFRYLHENVLTAKYDINCTDPATVLETGKYNCVSATLFFNVLAERAGINACALEMPGHALSRVKHQTLAGANSFDLETTYAGWFSLPNEEQRRAATESKIASNSAPQTYTVAKPVINDQNSSMKKIRELTPVQFVAIVYYNKGFDYLKAERYADAVNANAKALTLDPQNENAWKNLLAAINNWAIACIDKDQNRFDLAVELLEYGLQIDETYDMFRTNMRSVFCQWIQSLQKEGRANDAMTVYHFAIERLPNDEVLKSLVETK
ncbi:MAG: tetratricopeptide repeat protein [Planctomycetaceae bacterium]|nr:tetratricopeptide repeat protein [Planctomycetaceae bacterium]